MSSSQHQNSDEPSVLLRTLAAVFSGVLFGWFLSKRHTPDRESLDSNHTQDNTTEERGRRQYAPQSPTRVIVESLPPTSAPHEEEKAEKRRERRPQWCIFAVNLLTLVAVSWYACVATKSNTINRVSFYREQRAWISVKKAQITGVMPGTKPLVALYLLNTGKTPAIEQWSRGAIDIGPNPPPESKYVEPKQTEQSLSIVPVGDVGNWIQIDDPTLTKEKITLFYSIDRPDEARRLYVHATIHYRDVFGCKHFTEVCMYHRIQDPPDSFRFCDRFNGIDFETKNKQCD